jgi:hypothetical protein
MRPILLVLAAATASAQVGIKPDFQQWRGGPISISVTPGTRTETAITALPYSGNRTSEQTLSDGTHMWQSQVREFRDSSGRTRKEYSGQGFGSLTIVTISDPVAGYSWVLDPVNPIAYRIPLQSKPRAGSNNPGPCDPGGPPATQTMPNGNVSTSWALGSKTIQGIPACGRGSTIASKSGGTTTFENWFSQSDIGGVLLIKVTDAHGGTNVTQLIDMTFTEPNTNLFLLPSGYRVVDQTAAFTITAPAPVPAPTNSPITRSTTMIALTGMPWSGELMSGSTVLTRQYRDSMGRTRREQVFGAASRVEIFDPVAGLTYMLDIVAKTARRSAVSAQFKPASEATPPVIASGTQILKGGAAAVTQSLGTKTISGVVTYGTRTTITYPPGTISGNDKTTSSVNEAWYAPQLGASVMNSSSGALVPNSSTEVTKLNYSEPDPSLFQVPSDYRIIDEK